MVYTPQRGFMQSAYYDQQATALAGMLANASDINLVDSAFVGPVGPDGLEAGLGIAIRPTTVSNRPGINTDMMILPLDTATDDDFAGIVVRNQAMRSNAAGHSCLDEYTMGNYARRNRAGCRIWVQLEDGTAVYGGKVYWIVRDTAGTGKKIGAFAAAAISGSATPTPGTLSGGTININDAKSITAGGFDITVGGTLAKVVGMDFSGVSTVAEIATIVQQGLTAVSAAATVTVNGNAIKIATTATGASATLTFASAPTGDGSPTDASTALGLTAAAGAILNQGSAGLASDTVELTNARFLGTFTAGASACNNIALVELL